MIDLPVSDIIGLLDKTTLAPSQGIKSLPGSKLLQLPGTLLEQAVTETGETLQPEDTPLRTYDDLKHQYFGPALLNKQRPLEIADALLYQGAYGLPAAIAGGVTLGPPGAFAGLAAGKLLGQLHYLDKERKRLGVAKKHFNSNERVLLDKVTKAYRNWGLGSALVGGLAGGGASYALGQDRFGKTLTPILAGLGTASLGLLAGGLLGQHLALRKAKQQSKPHSDIIAKHRHF